MGVSQITDFEFGEFLFYMKCPNCGEKMRKGAVFCLKCGCDISGVPTHTVNKRLIGLITGAVVVVLIVITVTIQIISRTEETAMNEETVECFVIGCKHRFRHGTNDGVCL